MSGAVTTDRPAAAASPFAGLEHVLAAGFDEAAMTSDQMQRVALSDIEILTQVRTEFEDNDDTLAELGDSLVVRQLQNIVVRPNLPGRPKRYRLVTGERRVRAALAKGLRELWALVAYTMTDEAAEWAQVQENINRKNLNQLELARKLQRDLDRLGSVEAVLAEHKKSRGWLTKLQGLLKLPPQTQRLVTENVSADIEVINGTARIERANPERAAQLVDDLKEAQGKKDARSIVDAARHETKPPNPNKMKPRATPPKGDSGGSVATPRDRSQEEPSQARSVKPRGKSDATSPCEDILGRAYVAMFERGQAPQAALHDIPDSQREACDAWLRTHYEAGKKAKGLARGIVQGLRLGHFATDGAGAFAMAAFLDGAEAGVKFSLLDVFGALKV